MYPLALRLTWESADAIWRWAGDVATDENHYSKRVLLAEILISTLAIQGNNSGEADAATHLDGRIGAVMAFETMEGGAETVRVRQPGWPLRLGRLRYGTRLDVQHDCLCATPWRPKP